MIEAYPVRLKAKFGKHCLAGCFIELDAAQCLHPGGTEGNFTAPFRHCAGNHQLTRLAAAHVLYQAGRGFHAGFGKSWIDTALEAVAGVGFKV